MSTEANAALAWPVEITEFARIGDQLVERKKTTALVREVWVRTDEPRIATALKLCGTELPGAVRLSVLHEEPDLSHYADAGFYEDPRNTDPVGPVVAGDELIAPYPPVPRPAVGDPRMDPTILEEGCWAPWVTPPWLHTSDTWFDEEEK